MLYLVRTVKPRGYLLRGHIVKRRDNATAYPSPWAAARAIKQATAAGLAGGMAAVPLKPPTRTMP